jgi:hypothetical protein
MLQDIKFDNDFKVTCNAYTFYKGNLETPLKTLELTNRKNKIFSDIQLNFKFHFNPKDWANDQSE